VETSGRVGNAEIATELLIVPRTLIVEQSRAEGTRGKAWENKI
jgi:hypothetical protein